jgi:excisionase family DNA binding protein
LELAKKWPGSIALVAKKVNCGGNGRLRQSSVETLSAVEKQDASFTAQANALYRLLRVSLPGEPAWFGNYILPRGSGVSVKGLNIQGMNTHKHPSSFASDAERATLRANGNGVSVDQILLTVEELAEILRVPKSWIYSHQDQLPTVRLGRYVRFKRSEIESFLDKQRLANDTV